MIFLNLLGLLDSYPTSKLEDHPMLDVYICLHDIFIANVNNLRAFNFQPQFEAVPCLGDNGSTRYTSRYTARMNTYYSKKYSAREVQTFYLIYAALQLCCFTHT